MADSGKIQASMIIEILGRPPEHIKTALEDLVKKLGEEKGIKVKESKVHEPVIVKDSKDIYTTFAEVLLEFDSLANYFGIIFTYMPAHIELTFPENFSLSNSELNELGNKLLARLHDYDAITKKFIYERKFLMEKLREVAPHLFKNPEKTETEEKPEGKVASEETLGDKENSQKKEKKKNN